MSNQASKVAYLVVCWNNSEIIAECLDAINNQSVEPKAIYVIDNNSEDGTAYLIERDYPEVNLVQSDKNHGFSKGNNILIKKALKDSEVTHIALINSDAMLDSRWTEEILNYIKGRARVAAAQGTTLDYYNRNLIDAQHIFIKDDLQAVQYGYGIRYWKAQAYPRRVFGVNAAAALYTREFIEAQPRGVLFDERFYMYLEDVDVALRSVIAGWASYYVPAAEAYHMGSVSSKKRSNDYNLYMTYRNQLSLLVKSLPLTTLLRHLPVFLRNELNYYRFLMREGDYSALKMVVKGRIVGVIRAPLFLGSRIRLLFSRQFSTQRLERLIRNSGIF